MTADLLQCARVDTMPGGVGRANLPNVLDFTTTAACTRCRAQVWISRPARNLISSAALRPVCDVCQPAAPVSLSHLHDGDT